MKDVRRGSIIRGSNWPEPVEIKLIEEDGNYVHIVGATISSGDHVDQIIPIDVSAHLFKVFHLPLSMRGKEYFSTKNM
ncbi:MAG: hypothetical protein SVK08_13955, partial [Halobacteriota archaeon]|nr:hypothetical protein [Halobacteriota archaeon]